VAAEAARRAARFDATNSSRVNRFEAVNKRPHPVAIRRHDRAAGVREKMLTAAGVVEAHVPDAPAAANVVALIHAKNSIFTGQAVRRDKTAGLRSLALENESVESADKESGWFHGNGPEQSKIIDTQVGGWEQSGKERREVVYDRFGGIQRDFNLVNKT